MEAHILRFIDLGLRLLPQKMFWGPALAGKSFEVTWFEKSIQHFVYTSQINSNDMVLISIWIYIPASKWFMAHKRPTRNYLWFNGCLLFTSWECTAKNFDHLPPVRALCACPFFVSLAKDCSSGSSSVSLAQTGSFRHLGICIPLMDIHGIEWYKGVPFYCDGFSNVLNSQMGKQRAPKLYQFVTFLFQGTVMINW